MNKKLVINFIIPIYLSVIFYQCDNKLETVKRITKEIPVPNDSTIAFVYGSRELGLHIGITFDHNIAYSLTSGPFETNAKWSHDKKWLVFTKTIDQNEQIWRIDYNGKNKKALTSMHLYCNYPNISADGQKIVFGCLVDSIEHIIIIDTDGQYWQQVTNSNIMFKYKISRFFYPDWYPDGTHILFNYNSSDWSKVGLGLLDLNSSEVVFLSRLDSLCPFYAHVSPARDEIVFVGNGWPGVQIYRANLDGSNIIQLTNSFMASFPDWSSDGERIAYVQWESLSDQASAIWVMNRDGKNKRKAVDIAGHLCSNPSW